MRCVYKNRSNGTISTPFFAKQKTEKSRPPKLQCNFGGRTLCIFSKAKRRIRHKVIMYYLYILLSEAKNRTYTGVAEDVDKRLAEHNAGRVKSSSPYRPYKMIHAESFETLSEARQKEKFYKSTTGRRRLKEMLFKA